MQEIAQHIEQHSQQFQKLLPMPAENQKKWDKKIRLEFNYNSNHLEGNTLTNSETELLLIFDNINGGHTMREFEEMKAHDVAFQLIHDWAKDPRPLAKADIKNLNKIILVRPFWKDATTSNGQKTRRLIQIGNYKEQSNSVELPNGEIFEYASPDTTPILMGELLAWLNTELEKGEAPAWVVAAVLHNRFVRIHPFDDGNGRTARLLMNYILLAAGLPPVVIKSAQKAAYLRALNAADAGDLNSFVKYVGEQLVWSLDLGIRAARGENIEDADDLDKEISVLKKELAAKKQLEKQADFESTCEAVEENIFPLLQLLEEKVGAFKEHFFETRRHLNITYKRENGYFQVGSEESGWENIKKNWFENQVKLNRKRLESMRYSFGLMGFKNLVSADSFSVSVMIEFRGYNFTIEIQNQAIQPFTEKN